MAASGGGADLADVVEDVIDHESLHHVVLERVNRFVKVAIVKREREREGGSNVG